MKKIAFICGGNSVEKEISCLTALKIVSELKKANIDCLLIYLDQKMNFHLVNELTPKFVEENKLIKGGFLKKRQKSFFKTIKKKYQFDYVSILGHGKNIEEGNLKTYFDMLNIPCLSESIYNGVILQDKSKFKMALNYLNIPSLPHKTIYKYQIEKSDKIKQIINKFSFPLIIKPSTLGSSIGINIVENKDKLKEALIKTAYYDDVILIEPFIKNKIEINTAIMGYENEIYISSLEEVNDSKSILSFYDKYDYSSSNKKRIINPNIDEKVKNKVIDLAKKVFENLHLCGIVRFDFIIDLDQNKIYLNEANLIPGSLAYYLFKDQFDIPSLVEKYIDILLKKHHQQELLLNKFDEGFMNKIDLSKLKK